MTTLVPLLPPFRPGTYTVTEAGTRLIGSQCSGCGRFVFPSWSTCATCETPTQAVFLAPSGSLYSYTVVRIKPPFDLPAPYAVGYVHLPENNLRVFGLLDPHSIAQYQIGLPMRITCGTLGSDLEGRPCIRPYFEVDRRWSQ